jgi:hypothetical protein
VPEVVKSWPEERNTTEFSVTFRALSKRSPEPVPGGVPRIVLLDLEGLDLEGDGAAARRHLAGRCLRRIIRRISADSRLVVEQVRVAARGGVGTRGP